MKIKLPNSLIQKIQGDYVDSNFKDGVFTFHNISINTMEIVIESMLSWAKENNLIEDTKFDISMFLKGIKND